MRVHITSIHHNCFCLRFADRLLLFDCPGPEYRDPAAQDRLKEQISGSRVDVFASHSHRDHFAPDILELVRGAAETRFFVAQDVADLFGDRIPRGSVILEPGSTREIGDMSLSALASNDLGVAFLLRKQGLTLYFGGDLADWQWPGLPRAARRAASIFFGQALQELKHRDVHLAFSNADPRLDNLSGRPASWTTSVPTSSSPCMPSDIRNTSSFSGKGFPRSRIPASSSMATPGTASSQISIPSIPSTSSPRNERRFFFPQKT